MMLTEDKITPHFRLSEFANNEDGGAMVLNPDVINFIQMLEEFRMWYDRPVNITSGFRTKQYNQSVGGVSNSYHLKGLAVDFRLPNEFYRFEDLRKEEFLDNIKSKWYEICDRYIMPSTGQKICGSVLFYPNWVHLDVRTGKRYFEDKRGN